MDPHPQAPAPAPTKERVEKVLEELALKDWALTQEVKQYLEIIEQRLVVSEQATELYELEARRWNLSTPELVKADELAQAITKHHDCIWKRTFEDFQRKAEIHSSEIRQKLKFAEDTKTLVQMGATAMLDELRSLRRVAEAVLGFGEASGMATSDAWSALQTALEGAKKAGWKP
jgi:hypothetical protein